MAIPTVSALERAFSKIKDWAGIRNAAKIIHDGMSGGGGSGTVTSITATTPIVVTPSPLTTTGAISITDTAVTPGSYTSTNLTVDQKGRITAAANGSAGVTPASLTETDDTNVTLTLGGTPATALLQATSITAGWTGTLAVPRGGTGAATTSAHNYFGNNTGSPAAPTFHQIDYSELTGTPAAAGPRGLVFGSARSTGIITGKINGYVTVDYGGTITGYTLSKSGGSSVTIVFWKKADGSALPTVGDSISTSGLTLSGDHVRSSTVSDFTTTTVTAGDVFAVQITAVSGTITDFAGTLEITPS